MRLLYLVYQEHAGRWDWSKGLREQVGFEEHARFLLGGPLDEKDVLLVVDAAGIDEVRTHFADDPWIENGMLRIKEIRPWLIALDSTM